MSFIRDYMKFVELNEAHENYHQWCCFLCLSAIAARRVWVRRTYEIIYPNLYVVLVGPQGNRKTAAKNIAQGVMRSIGNIPFASEATTREALIQQMEDSAESYMYQGAVNTFLPMTVCVTELKEFLSVDPARMINFLTAIYDSDFFDYSTRGRGTNVLTNPCLNLLACETPEWLTERLKDKIVSGGFSRRVLYVYERDHKRLYIEHLPTENIRARGLCVEAGKRIQQLCGEFQWTSSAKDFYRNWYLAYQIPPDSAMMGYHESKHTLVLKVAMLIALSESEKLVLDHPHIDAAMQFLTLIERNMPRVFIGGGRNELGTVGTKANDYLLQRATPVKEKDLLVYIWGDCRDFRERSEVLSFLYASGTAIRLMGPNNIPYIVSTAHLRSVDTAKFFPAGSQQSSSPSAPTKSDSSPGGGQPSGPPSTAA